MRRRRCAGPRLTLLRSPPDTGKTSLAPSLPELFPDQLVVFCCLARRVNLEVASVRAALQDKTALARIGAPEDIAGPVAFLFR